MTYSARLLVFAIGVALVFATLDDVSWSHTRKELAGVHFVSPDGDAAWGESVDKSEPCSPETAFANAKAGDTVYFRGGTYRVEEYGKPYQGTLGPANSGTKNKPITFAAYPGEKAVFEGAAELRGQGRKKNYQLTIRPVGNQFQSYIVFDGFHFVEKDRTGFCGIIISRGCDNRDKPENWVKGCVVRNCTFDGGDFVIGSHPNDNPNSADNNEAIRIEETEGTLIQNCRIWNILHVKHNHNISAIKMYYNKDAIVENCEIYRCSTAIYDKGRSSGSVFRDNYNSVPDWKASGNLVGRGNPGEGSLDCNPGFVNSSGSFERLDDFRLAGDSP